MGWERVVYKRKDLFDQVWAEPVSHVAKRIGISDVALAKICRSMSIPLPGRGYWARKAVGSAPSKPTLRPAKSGTPLTYERPRYVAAPTEIEGEANIRAEVERLVTASPRLVVPEVLVDPHSLVARASAILEGKRSAAVVRLRKRCLDVEVQGEAFDRALRIMDTTLKALEVCGHTVEVTAPHTNEQGTPPASEPSKTLIHVGDSQVQIAIDETIKKIPLPLPEPRKPRGPYDYVPRPKREYEYRPTGKLHLRIVNVSLLGARQVWSDRKGDGVEDHLSDFVASVAVAGERQRLDRIEAEKRRQDAIARARRERAIELHNNAYEVLEADARERLTDWRFARDIRGLADAVRARALAGGNPIEPESPIGLWIEWSQLVVEYYDKRATAVDALRKADTAYRLAYRFGWSHKVTMDDALGLFFKPIDDLVREDAEKEERVEQD